MKVPLSWLKEYVAIALPPPVLAERLTLSGFEVKGVEITGGSWENIVVGQITAVNPHPNADRLRLATVELGNGPETVVCGAPNLNIGDKIVFARVGAQLIDGHTGKVETLKTAKIRGVTSSGMVCSEKELGISEQHEGILVLPAEAPVGAPLGDYLGDAILNLEITPNRPDCLSVIGIAREIAALTGQSLHLPPASYEETAAPIEQQIAVEILAPDLCPRYCANLVSGVKLTDSPQWLQQRLLACGMRPINNIVDVTNYVMLEYGQPLHAFDYSRIRGKKIIVRRAKSGETIVTLDGAERALAEEMLVIADEGRAVAVAGVMGGANSEVTDGTTTILLESASFHPGSIYYTGKALRLPSEACMRFERGIRADLTLPALRRATQLLVELAGGKAAKGIIDVYPGKLEPAPILLSTARVNQFLGTDFSFEQIVTTLTSLGFACQPTDSATGVLVTAPYWRSDIRLAVDLIEEIVRITGYDKIPTTTLSQSIPQHSPDLILGLRTGLRQRLIGYGFQEVITFSLTSLEMLSKLSAKPYTAKASPLRVANPMSPEQEYLRPTLRANLLAALAANRRYESGAIKLFELGRIFLPRPKDLPDEREILCGLLSKAGAEKSWRAGDEPFDFFAAKGLVESLLSRSGVEAGFEASADESLHPAKQAAIVIGGQTIGVIGELAPGVLAGFEIAEPTSLFEIDLRALLPFTLGHKMYQPLPRFPAVVRDIALVVDASIAYQRILNIIKSFPLVTQAAIFDVYSGEQVPSGKKSLAYRITFQSESHTLTDSEADEVQQQMLSRLNQELGATLRA